MEVHVTHETVDERTAVVTTSGELDVYTAPQWRAYVLDVLDRENPWHMGLDFTEVGYWDSVAIGALVRILKEFRDAAAAAGRRQGVFAMFAVQERTAHILKITGLDTVFRVVATRADFLHLVGEAEGAAGAAA